MRGPTPNPRPPSSLSSELLPTTHSPRAPGLLLYTSSNITVHIHLDPRSRCHCLPRAFQSHVPNPPDSSPPPSCPRSCAWQPPPVARRRPVPGQIRSAGEVYGRTRHACKRSSGRLTASRTAATHDNSARVDPLPLAFPRPGQGAAADRRTSQLLRTGPYLRSKQACPGGMNARDDDCRYPLNYICLFLGVPFCVIFYFISATLTSLASPWVSGLCGSHSRLFDL